MIVERAREFLTGEDIRFEDMLEGIEKRRQEIETERLEIKRLREEAESLREEIKAEKERLIQQRNGIISKAREESRTLLGEAKQTADRLLAEIRKAAADRGKEAIRAGEAAGRELARLKSDTEESLYKEYSKRTEDGNAPKSVMQGQSVYVIPTDGMATVLKPADKNGSVYIQAGIMKMYVKLADIRIIDNGDNDGYGKNVEKRKTGGRGSCTAGPAKAFSIKTELDLRGFNTEEALSAADKYIDDAIIARLSVCSIIHGKGTGKLRREIHDMLKKDKRVKSFRLGEYGEGDSGVTVVELKI